MVVFFVCVCVSVLIDNYEINANCSNILRFFSFYLFIIFFLYISIRRMKVCAFFLSELEELEKNRKREREKANLRIQAWKKMKIYSSSRVNKQQLSSADKKQKRENKEREKKEIFHIFSYLFLIFLCTFLNWAQPRI